MESKVLVVLFYALNCLQLVASNPVIKDRANSLVGVNHALRLPSKDLQSTSTLSQNHVSMNERQQHSENLDSLEFQGINSRRSSFQGTLASDRGSVTNLMKSQSQGQVNENLFRQYPVINESAELRKQLWIVNNRRPENSHENIVSRQQTSVSVESHPSQQNNHLVFGYSVGNSQINASPQVALSHNINGLSQLVNLQNPLQQSIYNDNRKSLSYNQQKLSDNIPQTIKQGSSLNIYNPNGIQEVFLRQQENERNALVEKFKRAQLINSMKKKLIIEKQPVSQQLSPQKISTTVYDSSQKSKGGATQRNYKLNVQHNDRQVYTNNIVLDLKNSKLGTNVNQKVVLLNIPENVRQNVPRTTNEQANESKNRPIIYNVQENTRLPQNTATKNWSSILQQSCYKTTAGHNKQQETIISQKPFKLFQITPGTQEQLNTQTINRNEPKSYYKSGKMQGTNYGYIETNKVQKYSEMNQSKSSKQNLLGSQATPIVQSKQNKTYMTLNEPLKHVRQDIPKSIILKRNNDQISNSERSQDYSYNSPTTLHRIQPSIQNFQENSMNQQNILNESANQQKAYKVLKPIVSNVQQNRFNMEQNISRPFTTNFVYSENVNTESYKKTQQNLTIGSKGTVNQEMKKSIRENTKTKEMERHKAADTSIQKNKPINDLAIRDNGFQTFRATVLTPHSPVESNTTIANAQQKKIVNTSTAVSMTNSDKRVSSNLLADDNSTNLPGTTPSVVPSINSRILTSTDATNVVTSISSAEINEPKEKEELKSTTLLATYSDFTSKEHASDIIMTSSTTTASSLDGSKPVLFIDTSESEDDEEDSPPAPPIWFSLSEPDFMKKLLPSDGSPLIACFFLVPSSDGTTDSTSEPQDAEIL